MESSVRQRPRVLALLEVKPCEGDVLSGGWESLRRGGKFSHQRVSIESAVKMCQRRFYYIKYTSFHKNHIKLFAVYMKTANLMQNFNVLKRSL